MYNIWIQNTFFVKIFHDKSHSRHCEHGDAAGRIAETFCVSIDNNNDRYIIIHVSCID
jgi:hypothetical protein